MNGKRSHLLKVDRIKDRTQVLGPGVRVAIWFHGCNRNCPGCIAREMNRGTNFDYYEPAALAERIGAVRGIEGITVSGGEPFDQDAGAMRDFLSRVKSRNMGVMAYSGYTIEEILHDADRSGILKYVDVLVDGPYVEEQDHGELWRGSSNQRMHFLTDHYENLCEGVMSSKGRPVEVDVGKTGVFSFAGVPPRGFRRKLSTALKRKGLEIKW